MLKPAEPVTQQRQRGEVRHETNFYRDRQRLAGCCQRIKLGPQRRRSHWIDRQYGAVMLRGYGRQHCRGRHV